MTLIRREELLLESCEDSIEQLNGLVDQLATIDGAESKDERIDAREELTSMAGEALVAIDNMRIKLKRIADE